MLGPRNLILMLIAIAGFSCTEETTVSKTAGKKKKKSSFVFRERMVSGHDTAMIHIRANVEAVLAQHWYLDDLAAVSDDKLVWENGDGTRLFPSLNLFPDSTALENPRSGIKPATWHRELSDKINTIVMNYGDKQSRTYRIRELSLRNLTVSWKDGTDSLWIRYRSDGMAHQDIRNDPYYPANNHWRIKPAHKESETEIRQRVKDCVRFYALYYRDHIKRHKKVIEFIGLPEIFRWYNGGIGLPMKSEMSESWVSCFYNRDQAERGYDILKNLIDVYEFDWPTGTPGWHYRTHSVLEQMYEKL
jgi:hypothetical protein